MIRFFLALLLFAPTLSAELLEDIEFAKPDGVSLKLDVHVPEGEGPFPTVIIVHGGGWEAGDKTTYVPPLFPPLTEAGFVWFTIDYRLAPEHQFPACMDDAFAAIRWVREHAAKYKVDVDRIALVGESAGGHIVSYVGATAEHNSLAAVVPMYGLHDLLLWEEQRGEAGRHMKQLLGIEGLGDEDRRKLIEASPIAYVHENMPPYLMIHGTADTGAPLEQSEVMCAKMREMGNECEMFPVEGAPHGIGNWEGKPEFEVYKPKLVAWLKAVLK